MSINPAQLPFKQASDFFRNKLTLPSAGWTDLWQQQHSHAFVVAGAQSDALLEDLYNAIQDAKQNGGGYADFKQRFQTITTRHGWSYHGTPNWRSRVIYDTNITQSYNAGRYVQMQAVKHLRPFWQYRHTSIEHPRLNHQAWNGILLSADDAWWDTYMPQNGWGCKCRVDSLSRYETEQALNKQGKSTIDTAPPVVYEERIVGKNSSHPRTVTVPQGIDPGFGYNAGKSYLEPLTVPPLQGYDAVLKERGAEWPTSFKAPELPKPTTINQAALLGKETPPQQAVTDFLKVFGADMQQGAAFTDAAGTTIAITKALFTDGKGEFKWLAKDKAERLEYINLMAMALIEPDEIWWMWEKDIDNKKNNLDAPAKWRLKRRYLRAFEIDDADKYAIGVFEWGKAGWSGSTIFVTTDTDSEAKQLKYFDAQRRGKLVYKK